MRQALKEVELDSSRRVELEDYVGVSANRIRSVFMWQFDAELAISSHAARRQGPRGLLQDRSSGRRSADVAGRSHLQRTGGHVSKGSIGGAEDPRSGFER